MGDTTTDSAKAAQDFIQKWTGKTASELSTAQSFVNELCVLLGVVPPTHELDYMFERPITFRHGDGTTSPGRIDCYRRGHFALEAKKLKTTSSGKATKGFDDAMYRARAQAEGYARALPAIEGRPPFCIVVDVGNVIELYAEFSRSGATYTPFPDPKNHRIKLADLVRPDVRATLRAIWTDPTSLDPARASARVTREVAGQLAGLAKSMEQSAHRADHVGAFLIVPQWRYIRPRKAQWPKADFVVGNPPFIGNKRMRDALGVGYTETLRQVWPDVRSQKQAALLTFGCCGRLFAKIHSH